MKNLTIDDMHERAAKRNGLCLSTEYVNSQTNLLWQCEKGHQWYARPNNIKAGKWCRYCSGNIPLTIDEAHIYAQAHGGKCLTPHINKGRDKILWECQEGHQWSVSLTTIKSNATWCDKCGRKKAADNLRGSLDDLNVIAFKHGGKCLSTEYVNSQTPLQFRCKLGHTWFTAPNNIRRGTWCKKCDLKRNRSTYTIEDAYHIATFKGGYCISVPGDFINARIPSLTWKCNNGHEWNASLENVMRTSWCKLCGFASSATKRLKDMSSLHSAAEKRGGKCLAISHKGVNRKIEWQCAMGHQWKATPAKILNGNWCQQCGSFTGQRICKYVLEYAFQSVFPTQKPEWLISSKGNRLELDGYCEKLKIAFEHHGSYHYGVDGFFSKTIEDVQKRQFLDTEKTELCVAHGVKIIVIPEIFQLTPIKKLPKVILQECIEKGINVPADFQKRLENAGYQQAYATPKAKGFLEELKILALERGGQCLSTEYISSQNLMNWRCKQGHYFATTSNAVKRGSWCLECSGRKRLTIEEMQLLALSRGGECLSETYVNALTKLKWRCSAGHEWDAVANSVKHRGTWCKLCCLDK